MILDMLYKRRSRRDFLDKPIEKEKIDALAQAVLLSPTSKNRYPWEFIFVDDPTVIADLAEAKEHGSAFLRKAPLAVVIAADFNKSDVWIEDSSIAAYGLQLSAEELGLGSCWIQIRNRKHISGISAEDYVRHICGLPSNFGIDSIIALGYSGEEKKPKKKEDLLYEKIHRNSYSNG